MILPQQLSIFSAYTGVEVGSERQWRGKYVEYKNEFKTVDV